MRPEDDPVTRPGGRTAETSEPTSKVATTETSDADPSTTVDAAASGVELPPGARVWPNRSDEPDAPYQQVPGLAIAFADDTWYALDDDGSWHPFAHGPLLDPSDAPVPTEAFQLEVVSGTAMFPTSFAQLGLRVEGSTGGLVTPDGTTVDPITLELIRGSDGTIAWFDTASATWWPFDFSVTLADPPPGPHLTVAAGPGANPPLDTLAAGTSLELDWKTGRYLDPDTGAVVGVHQGHLDDVQRWDNRSGDADAGYADLAGPSVVFFDDTWYGVLDDGTWLPFHDGPVLDPTSVAAPFSLEYLHFEVLVGTPLFGQGTLADLGLRLDGATGALIDTDGNVVDPQVWDPWTTHDLHFGVGDQGDRLDAREPEGESTHVTTDDDRERGDTSTESARDPAPGRTTTTPDRDPVALDDPTHGEPIDVTREPMRIADEPLTDTGLDDLDS